MAVLLTALPASWAELRNAGMPVVPSATGRFTVGLERVLRGAGMNRSDLSFRDDYLPEDEFRLSCFNHWMRHPLNMAGDFDQSSDQMLNGGWRDRLKVISGWAGVTPSMKEDRSFSGLQEALAGLWGGRRVPASQRRKMKRLEKRLPVEVQALLTRLVALHLDVSSKDTPLLNQSGQEELLHLILRFFSEEPEDQDSLEEEEVERLLELFHRTEWKSRLAENFRGFMAAGEFLTEATPVQLTDQQALQGVLGDFETPRGRLIIGGVDRQTYLLGNLGEVIILDLGGDDLYLKEKDTADYGNHEYLIDLDGHDEYMAFSAFGFGATLGGFSLLWDVRGNDRYRGSQLNFGAGVAGMGFLVDQKGDDIYECASGGQGMGMAGMGLVFDFAGNDQYQGGSCVQGVGGPGGVGVLMDSEGDDLYAAGNRFSDEVKREPGGYINFSQGFGFGLRPYCSGGLGVLLDGRGEDRYIASYFAQGSNYWLAAGALVDRDGNDFYEAMRYSQGAGIHLGAGLLFDHSGHDVYNLWGVGQGCGHDLSVGVLWDSEGDDLYRGSWLYGGAGYANGIGLLVDGDGDDHYVPSSVSAHHRPFALGYGQFVKSRDLESVGIHLDLGGEDYFGDRAPAGLQRMEEGIGLFYDYLED